MPDATSLHYHISPKEIQDLLLTLQRKRTVVFREAQQNLKTLGSLSGNSLLLLFQFATYISFPLKHQYEA